VAPLAAAAAGLPLGIAFAASHWLPHWSSLSDSFVEGGTAGFSYVASALEIAGALAIGIVGVTIVRERGLATYSTRSAAA
jgi:hypothetical protein